MPLVFAMNEATESGHAYEDVPYQSYEYPAMYRSAIVPGERFVYYRGRRMRGGGRQLQVYLGAGVVGEIRPSANTGRLVCDVYGEEFDMPLPFRAADGTPLEPGG